MCCRRSQSHGTYQFGTAAFGPPVGSPNVTANCHRGGDPADRAGPGTTDGCSAFTNAAAVAGNIALIERGTCGFAVKARNATNAGAAAVIIYNNAANAGAAPPGMADDGINGAFVTIPAVSMRRADGLAIIGRTRCWRYGATVRRPVHSCGCRPGGQGAVVRSESAGCWVIRFALRLDRQAKSLDGAGDQWGPDAQCSSPDDLTLELFRDIGWFPDADMTVLRTATTANRNPTCQRRSSSTVTTPACRITCSPTDARCPT